MPLGVGSIRGVIQPWDINIYSKIFQYVPMANFQPFFLIGFTLVYWEGLFVYSIC